MHRGNVQHPVVCEAIQPVFAGFVRLDDGMIPVVCVLSRVPARAGVTATNMAADSAAAQVNPPAFRLHAFHTAWTAGCSFLNEINVSAGLAHDLPSGYSMTFRWKGWLFWLASSDKLGVPRPQLGAGLIGRFEER